MAQHAILRFEKHKGNPARPLEAHHERQKEQYASNPDIDTSRSKYNFHIVKPEGRYYHFIQSRIEQDGCRTRRDSTRFVDTLITASPEFFEKKSPKEIQEFFQRAADFLIGRVGKENIVSAVVHMDEKTPHLHLVFVPLTEDNRLCAKEISIGFSNASIVLCGHHRGRSERAAGSAHLAAVFAADGTAFRRSTPAPERSAPPRRPRCAPPDKRTHSGGRGARCRISCSLCSAHRRHCSESCCGCVRFCEADDGVASSSAPLRRTGV